LCLPLSVDNAVVGVLTVSRLRLDAFPAGDEILLAALCERLGDIFEELRVFEDVSTHATDRFATGDAHTCETQH
jgi:hypothetical protein